MFLYFSFPAFGWQAIESLHKESFLLGIVAERSRKELTLVNPTYSLVGVKRKQVEVVQAKRSALFPISSAIPKRMKSVTVNSMRFYGILLQVAILPFNASLTPPRSFLFHREKVRE